MNQTTSHNLIKLNDFAINEETSHKLLKFKNFAQTNL